MSGGRKRAQPPGPSTDPAPLQSQAPQDRYLFCARKDGVGARLANLLWTWRLAQRADLRTLCFWPQMARVHGLSAGFRDLFDPVGLATEPVGQELKVVDGSPQDFIRAQIVNLEKRPEVRATELAATIQEARASGSFACVIDSGVPFLEPGEDEETALQEVRTLFARLPLNRIVRASVKAADKKHPLAGLIAVHVRRGDIVKTLRTACREFTPAELEPGSRLDTYTAHFVRCCPPTDAYFRLIREYRARRWKVLFFSDSPEAAEPFVRTFGDTIVVARDLAPEGLTQIQQALFELILMSRCRAVVGAKSMFSRVAGMLQKPRFIDARRHAEPAEFMGAYKQALRFGGQAAEVQAAAEEVLVRHLQRHRFDALWNADEAEMRRLFREA